MKKRNRIKKYIFGQITMETAILIVIIIVAMAFMGTYLKRAVSGRLRDAAGDFSGSFYNPKGNTRIDTTLNLTENQIINSRITGNRYREGELEDEYTINTWTDSQQTNQGPERTFLR